MDRQILLDVEQKIIIKGIKSGVLQPKTDKVVPLRDGKLCKTEFGEFLGKGFEFDGLLAINLYGYFKLSSGIYKAVNSVENIFPGIRSIKANIFHFNSIRTNDVREICGKNKDLFFFFVELKEYLLNLRFGEDRKAARTGEK